MNIVDEIRNDITGIEALHDWLGDQGEPVHPMVSELRGKICVTGNQGQPCPLNVEPGWWDRVKSKIADWIQAELQVKHNMNLTTPWDGQLNMCAACGCCLPLKVHTPTRVMKDHVRPDQLAKAPDYCWMRREIQNLQNL